VVEKQQPATPNGIGMAGCRLGFHRPGSVKAIGSVDTYQVSWEVSSTREQVAIPAPYEPKSTNLRIPASSRRWSIDGSPPWFDATPSHLAGETSSFVLRSSNPVKGRHDDFIWGIPKFSRCDQAARDQHDSP